MSRASGAGAYSHGIAWPSPRPQLDAAPDADVTIGTRVSLAIARHHTARHMRWPGVPVRRRVPHASEAPRWDDSSVGSSACSSSRRSPS